MPKSADALSKLTICQYRLCVHFSALHLYKRGVIGFTFRRVNECHRTCLEISVHFKGNVEALVFVVWTHVVSLRREDAVRLQLLISFIREYSKQKSSVRNKKRDRDPENENRTMIFVTDFNILLCM